jgi:hypothetical protein
MKENVWQYIVAKNSQPNSWYRLTSFERYFFIINVHSFLDFIIFSTFNNYSAIVVLYTMCTSKTPDSHSQDNKHVFTGLRHRYFCQTRLKKTGENPKEIHHNKSSQVNFETQLIEKSLELKCDQHSCLKRSVF